MTTTMASQVEIRSLSINDPWRWLQKGWQDFMQAPLIGMAHGLGVAVFGLFLLVIAYNQFWLLAGALLLAVRRVREDSRR